MFDTVQASFDELLAPARPVSAEASELLVQITEATRQENRSAAARLTAIGDLYGLQVSQRDEISDQWAMDTQCAVIAEVAAALTIGYLSAAAMVGYARGLRERLPEVARVFRAGDLTLRIVEILIARTGLIADPAILARIDTKLATAAPRLMRMSVGQVSGYVDRAVAKLDPDAVRRRKKAVEQREVWFCDGLDGMSDFGGTLLTADAHIFEQALEAMAATVCPNDPRTPKQRRTDAIRAVCTGAERLQCLCGDPACRKADAVASPFLIHIVSGPDTKGPEADDADGAVVDETADAGETVTTLARNDGLLSPEDVARSSETAKQRPIVHPGDAAPEPRYTPSRNLAEFVRARDLGCRFPGCDVAAWDCDLDHTIPYSAGGSTQASNLSCKCRLHHLLKTFWGWTDEQSTDGTLTWTSPAGQTYVTTPGARFIFPSLCTPTGPIVRREVTDDCTGDRSAMMPKRKRTRAQDRAARVAAERRANRELREARKRARRKAFEALYHPTPPSPDDEPPPF